MAAKQEALIYIEDENKTEAEFMSRSFVKKDLKNRAYINALGAELAIKYLTSEGFDTSDLHNMHSISKILEKLDISDIMLPNIHIDVRLIFDENQIFIPKSHFQLELTPDIYLVMKMAEDFSYVEFLGYFEPARINKNHQNKDYYFIEKDKLSSPDKLTAYIKNFTGDTNRGISEEDMLHARELYISMADHNISAEDEKELFELLLLSDTLRDSILEFDNFETLSYSVGSTVSDRLVDAKSPEVLPVSQDNSETLDKTEDIVSSEDESADGDEGTDNQADEGSTGESEENTDLEFDNQDEDMILDDSFFDELQEAAGEQNDSNTTDNTEEQERLTSADISTGFDDFDGVELIDNIDIDSDINNNSTDNINPPKNGGDLIVNAAGEVVTKTIETAAAGAAAAGTIAATGAAAKAAADVSTAGTVSREAMKLAGVSGEIAGDITAKILSEQHANLDRIDYTKSTTNATAVPEHIAAYDLSAAKMEADMEAEKSGQAEISDMSKLRQVENLNSKGYSEKVEQEIVDMDHMEQVKTEEFKETTSDLSDLSSMSEIDTPTTPIKNLNEKLSEEQLSEAENLSDMGFVTNTIDINADGTSSIDDINLDLGFDQNKSDDDENLVDLGIGDDFMLDDNNVEQISLNGFDENLSIDTGEELAENIQEDELTQSEQDSEPEEDKDTDEYEDLQESDDDQTSENDMDIDSDNIESLEINDDSILLDEDVQLNSSEIEEVDSTLQNDSPNIENENTDEYSEKIITEEETSEPISDIEEFPENTSDSEGSIEDFLDDFSQDNPENIDEILPEDETVQSENNSAETFDITEETIDEQEVNSPESEEDQDWLNDTNYDSIPDAEIPLQEETPEIAEEIISEPEETPAKAFAVAENSTVISDKAFTVGEIQIDINNPEQQNLGGPAQLENLYNENDKVPGAALLKNPGRMARSGGHSNAGLGVGLGIIGIILTLAIVGIIGFAVSKMIKQPSEEAPQPITDDTAPTSSDNGVTDANTLDIDQNNVVNMDNANQPAPSNPSKPAIQQPVTAKTTPVKQNTTSQNGNKKVPATSFLEVQKLTWEVPDYVSYNSNFKHYFQSAGKSLKLSLTSDLLLATDYVYSDQVRVSITFDKDGTYKNARILLSSGSKQVDDIVLQTVNQTLTALKAPHSIGNDESTTVILKIYF